MLYETKVSYKTRNDDGKDVLKKESYIVCDCVAFAQAEEKTYEAFNYDTFKDVDVTDIKRSRIKEIANVRKENTDKVFMAEIQDVFIDDNGDEKQIKYKIAFFAKDIDKAMSFITQYIKQGYDMLLVTLKETKFIDVF